MSIFRRTPDGGWRLATCDERVAEHVRMAHSARIVSRRVPALADYCREVFEKEMSLARGIRVLQHEGVYADDGRVIPQCAEITEEE